MRLLCLLAGTSLIGSAASGQAPCLVPGASHSTPGQAAGLLAADLDGDGRCDLVTGGSSVSAIALRYGQADGSLSAPVDVPLDLPVFPRSMRAADLDADQDVDLVLGHDGLLTVLLRQPGGSYAPTVMDLDFRLPNALALGDVDGDLDADAVAVDASTDQLLLFANDGAGSLASPTSSSSSAVWSTRIELADLEGDQDLDAWMVGIGDAFGPPPSFVLSTNSGGGAFTPAPALTFEDAVLMAVGDLEGDGDPDLALLERDAGRLHLHANAGGVPGAPITVQLPANQVDVLLADLDQDGDLDGDGAVDLAVTRGYPHVDSLTVLRGLCPSLDTSFCFGDGSATPCPCGNTGAPGGGCATSVSTGGVLTAAGSASVGADDLSFSASGLRPNQSALLFVGTSAINGGDGVPFGDGLRCAGVSVVRLGVQLPDAGGNASWGPGLAAQGGWDAGDTRRFQVWFRDPGGPCGSGFNLSQGVEVLFGS